MIKINNQSIKSKIIIMLVKEGKISEALELADINDENDLLGIGAMLFQIEKYSYAEEFFDKVTKLNSKSYAAWLLKGQSLSELGKYNQAIKCFDKAIEIRKDDSEVWNAKGVALEKFGKYKDAIKCFDKALKIDNNSATVWTNKGVALEKIGKYNEALISHNKSLKIYPKDSYAWYNKGVTLAKLGKNEEAIKCYNKSIKLNPKDYEVWSNKGFSLISLGKFKEAINCFNNSIKLNPNDKDTLNKKGATYAQLRRYDEAIKYFDKALKIDSNYASALVNKGTALGSIEKYSDSIKYLSKALNINPNYFHAWINKGIALSNQGKHDEAIKSYDNALRINPKSIFAWTNKGIELAYLEKSKEAIQCFENALEINPSDAEILINKCGALTILGKYDEAIQSCNKALRINPNFVEAYINKGIVLLNIHKYKEALIEFRKGRKLINKKGNKYVIQEIISFEKLALNAEKLVLKTNPLDRQFISCLTKVDLFDLKEESRNISNGINELAKEFKNTDLPDDAFTLLNSKITCFNALHNALNFKEVNINNLRNAVEIFEKWNHKSLAIAVESLIIFIQGIQKYKCLEEIPYDVKDYLLQFLKASAILDGNLTIEITNKIKEKPIITKPKSEGKRSNINYIDIAETELNEVKISLIQLDFSLSMQFPYKLKYSEKIKKKIFRALEIAEKEKVDIICFPELSFNEKWCEEIKNIYRDKIIICGSYYDKNYQNICRIIIDGKEYLYAKCHWSMMEEPNGEGLNVGNQLFIFQTKYGLISILNCIDYDIEYDRINEYSIDILDKSLDFIINPRYDIDNDFNYHKKSSLNIDLPTGNRNPTIFMHINAKRIKYGNSKGGGGTAIICNDHKYRIEKYKNDGLRPKDDIKYKICQAKNEMILTIILNFKSISQKRISMGNWYKFKDGDWKILKDKNIW